LPSALKLRQNSFTFEMNVQPRTQKGNTMNAKQLSAAKTSELVAFYNECAALLGRKPVTRFASRTVAELRCADIGIEATLHREELAKAAAPAKASKKAAWDRESCPSCGTKHDQTVGRVVERNGRQEEVDQHVGFCHHCNHTYNVNTGRPAKFTGEASSAERAAAIAASWNDPEVKAARVARHSVTVNGVEYRSVREAFRALGLPDSKHIKFRMDLKATGKQAFNGLVFILGE